MPANNEYYDDDNEYFFYIAMFHALFWTHTVYLLYVIYQQCNTDIFLVDWEKVSYGSAAQRSTAQHSLQRTHNN